MNRELYLLIPRDPAIKTVGEERWDATACAMSRSQRAGHGFGAKAFECTIHYCIAAYVIEERMGSLDLNLA